MKKLVFLTIIIFLSMLIFVNKVSVPQITGYLYEQDEKLYNQCLKGSCDIQFKLFEFEIQEAVKIMQNKDWEMIEVAPYEFEIFPNPKMIYYQYNDYVGMCVDYDYLNSRYSRFLNKENRDYLNVMSDFFTYYVFNMQIPNKENKMNEINSFIKKYPKSHSTKMFKQLIKELSVSKE